MFVIDRFRAVVQESCWSSIVNLESFKLSETRRVLAFVFTGIPTHRSEGYLRKLLRANDHMPY